jgi:hypothetical protein
MVDETVSGGGSGGVGLSGAGGGGLLRVGENEAESQEQGMPAIWELEPSQQGVPQPHNSQPTGDFVPAAAVLGQGQGRQGSKRSIDEQPLVMSPPQQVPPGGASAGQHSNGISANTSGGNTLSLGSLPPILPLVVNDAPKPGTGDGEGEASDGMETDLRSRRSVVEVLHCLEHRDDLLASAEPEDTEEMRQVGWVMCPCV